MTTSAAPQVTVVELLHEPDPTIPQHTATQVGPTGSRTITQAVCVHCHTGFPVGSLYVCRSRQQPAPAVPTPLDPDRMVRRPNRRGRAELWEAISADGDWAYIREESAGTYWHIEHLPTERVYAFAATTIASACLLTANGAVLAALDRKRTA
jgi:hypothetical protein